MKGTLANEDPVWHIGMIESVLEIDEAGLFVRWQTENGAWRIHVPTGVLPAGPKTGKVWRFLGRAMHHPMGGELWQVQRGERALPPGALISRFLSYHIPGLVEYRAARWQKRWPGSLGDALTRARYTELAEVLAPHPLADCWATQAVEYWQRQTHHLALVREMNEHEASDELAAHMLDHYGEAAAAMLNDDPYRMLAFASFATVDAIAGNLGVQSHDLRRLRGAVDDLMHQALDVGRDALPDSDLREALVSVLGDRVGATLAISASCQSGRIVNAPRDAWISDATSHVITFVATRLHMMCSGDAGGAWEPADRPEVDAQPSEPRRIHWVRGWTDTNQIAQLHSRLETAPQGGITVVVTDSAVVTNCLRTRLPGATIVEQQKIGMPCALLESATRVIWVTARARVRVLARILANVRHVCCLTVVDDGSARSGDDVVATMLKRCESEETRLAQLVTDDGRIPAIDSDGVLQLPSYDSRRADRKGDLVLQIAQQQLEAALLGVCYQAALEGSVCVVGLSDSQRDALLRQWHHKHMRCTNIVEMHTGTAPHSWFEGSEFETLIIVWPTAQSPTIGWWEEVHCLANQRTVVVATQMLKIDSSSDQLISLAVPKITDPVSLNDRVEVVI